MAEISIPSFLDVKHIRKVSETHVSVAESDRRCGFLFDLSTQEIKLRCRKKRLEFVAFEKKAPHSLLWASRGLFRISLTSLKKELLFKPQVFWEQPEFVHVFMRSVCVVEELSKFMHIKMLNR